MKIPNLPDRHQLVKIVNEAVEQSGVYDAFRSTSDFESKSDGTLVTEIDHAIQNAVFAKLRKFDVSLIGEEGSELNEGSKFAVAIDPLDGTEAFLRGIPTSSCAVTLLEKRDNLWFPVLAVITELYEGGSTWSAREHSQTYVVKNKYKSDQMKNEKECHIPAVFEPYFVTVSTWPGVPFDLENAVKFMDYSKLRNQAFGSIALGGGLIASGGTHGTVFAGNSALETIAMTLVVRGAGGVASDVYGKLLRGFELGVNPRDGKPDFLLPSGAIMASNMGVLGSLVKQIAAREP